MNMAGIMVILQANLIKLVRNYRIPGVSMICMVAYGNGVRIGTPLIRAGKPSIPQGLLREQIVCSGAAVGSMDRSAAGHLSAAIFRLISVVTSLDFALREKPDNTRLSSTRCDDAVSDGRSMIVRITT